MRNRTAAMLAVAALCGLALGLPGCGGGVAAPTTGGPSGNPGGGTPGAGGTGGGAISDTVAHLAGDYTFTLSGNGQAYAATISGSSNAISGSGTTATTPTADYQYSGTLSDTGDLTLAITNHQTGTVYNITGHVQQDAAGETSATASYTGSDNTAGAAAVARKDALPVASGPVNSLVATIPLPGGSVGPSLAVALAHGGGTLYMAAGSQLVAVKLADGSSRTAALSSVPSFLAVSGDDKYVFAGGAKLEVVSAATLADTPVTTSGPVQWLTTPSTSAAGSVAYFGTSDGAAHAINGAGPGTVTDLAAPAPSATWGDAAASGDGSRLLGSTAIGAVAAALPAGTPLGSPYRYAITLATVPTPVAASANGQLFYTVDSGQHPPRVFGLDVVGQQLLGSVTMGTLNTSVAAMALSPDGTRLVVVTTGVPRAFVLDAASMTVLQAVDVNVAPATTGVPSAAPARVAISSDSAHAYISGQSKLAVVRLK